MLFFSPRTRIATLVLGLRAPGVLPLTITGVQGTSPDGTSLRAGGNITITWTSVPADPSSIAIRLLQSNVLVPPDLADNVPTERGNITVELGVGLEAGQYDLEFQFFRAPVAQFDINITSSITSSSSQSQTGSSSLTTPSNGASASSAPASTSSTTSSTASDTPSQTGIPLHHSNAGAISAGVVGGVVAVFLALLGSWCFLRRSRRRETTARVEQDRSRLNISKESQYFPAPISAALAGTTVVDNDEFRPWAESEVAAGPPTPVAGPPGRDNGISRPQRDNGGSAGTATFVAAASPSADAKQRIVLRSDPPAPTPASRSDSGPSREELEDEVRRLREQVSSLSPPSYSAPE